MDAKQSPTARRHKTERVQGVSFRPVAEPVQWVIGAMTPNPKVKHRSRMQSRITVVAQRMLLQP